MNQYKHLLNIHKIKIITIIKQKNFAYYLDEVTLNFYLDCIVIEAVICFQFQY